MSAGGEAELRRAEPSMSALHGDAKWRAPRADRPQRMRCESAGERPGHVGRTDAQGAPEPGKKILSHHGRWTRRVGQQPDACDHAMLVRVRFVVDFVLLSCIFVLCPPYL